MTLLYLRGSVKGKNTQLVCRYIFLVFWHQITLKSRLLSLKIQYYKFNDFGSEFDLLRIGICVPVDITEYAIGTEKCSSKAITNTLL